MTNQTETILCARPEIQAFMSIDNQCPKMFLAPPIISGMYIHKFIILFCFIDKMTLFSHQILVPAFPKLYFVYNQPSEKFKKHSTLFIRYSSFKLTTHLTFKALKRLTAQNCLQKPYSPTWVTSL